MIDGIGQRMTSVGNFEGGHTAITKISIKGFIFFA